MHSPEILILSLNSAVALLAYFVAYPTLCGSNVGRIAVNDLLATITVLLVAGVLYAGTGHEFNLLLFSVNWFWFALITYTALELPLMLWYFHKYKLWDAFNT